MVVLTIGPTLATPAVGGEKKDTAKSATAVSTLITKWLSPVDLLDNFAINPIILNRLVKDVAARCEEIGLMLFGELVLITVLMAELLWLESNLY